MFWLSYLLQQLKLNTKLSILLTCWPLLNKWSMPLNCTWEDFDTEFLKNIQMANLQYF